MRTAFTFFLWGTARRAYITTDLSREPIKILPKRLAKPFTASTIGSDGYFRTIITKPQLGAAVGPTDDWEFCNFAR